MARRASSASGRDTIPRSSYDLAVAQGSYFSSDTVNTCDAGTPGSSGRATGLKAVKLILKNKNREKAKAKERRKSEKPEKEKVGLSTGRGGWGNISNTRTAAEANMKAKARAMIAAREAAASGLPRPGSPGGSSMATITPEYVNAQRRARILASKASSDPGRASMSISTTSVAPSDFSSVLNISHSPKSTPPTSPIFPITPGSAPRPHHPPKDRKNRKGVVFTSDNDSLRIRRNSGASVDVSVGAHELADVLNEQIGNWLSMEEEEESDDSPPSPVASSYLSAETTSLDGDSIYSEASDAYSGRDIMFASYAKSAPLILMMPKARGSPPTPPPQITRSSRLSAVPPLPPPVTPLPPTPQGLPPTPNSSAPRRPSFSRSPSQFANHASTQSTLPLRSPPFPAPPNSRLFPETPGHSELDLSALHIDPYPPPSPSREHRGQHIPSSELVALSRALQEERLALERSHAAERALLERRVQALQEEARQREMRVKELMWLFEHPTQPGVMMSPDDDEDLDPEPPRGRSLSRRSSVTSRS